MYPDIIYSFPKIYFYLRCSTNSPLLFQTIKCSKHLYTPVYLLYNHEPSHRALPRSRLLAKLTFSHRCFSLWVRQIFSCRRRLSYHQLSQPPEFGRWQSTNPNHTRAALGPKALPTLIIVIETTLQKRDVWRALIDRLRAGATLVMVGLVGVPVDVSRMNRFFSRIGVQ